MPLVMGTSSEEDTESSSSIDVSEVSSHILLSVSLSFTHSEAIFRKRSLDIFDNPHSNPYAFSRYFPKREYIS